MCPRRTYQLSLVRCTPLTLVQQNIQSFYPQGSLDMIAAKVASSGALDKIAQEWRMPKELASDLVSRHSWCILSHIGSDAP